MGLGIWRGLLWKSEMGLVGLWVGWIGKVMMVVVVVVVNFLGRKDDGRGEDRHGNRLWRVCIEVGVEVGVCAMARERERKGQ